MKVDDKRTEHYYVSLFETYNPFFVMLYIHGTIDAASIQWIELGAEL